MDSISIKSDLIISLILSGIARLGNYFMGVTIQCILPHSSTPTHTNPNSPKATHTHLSIWKPTHTWSHPAIQSKQIPIHMHPYTPSLIPLLAEPSTPGHT